MKKKMLSMLLSVAMTAALLAGCGSNAETAESTETTDSTEAADSTEADASAETGSTIKIGGIGPLTGGAAVYGLAEQKAAQIAIDEINAAGGVNGAQLELNFQDDECDAEKALNAYNNLKD